MINGDGDSYYEFSCLYGLDNFYTEYVNVRSCGVFWCVLVWLFVLLSVLCA